MATVPMPDPSLRRVRREAFKEEIGSLVRASDYRPPVRHYREVSPGHVVQGWGEEWSA